MVSIFHMVWLSAEDPFVVCHRGEPCIEMLFALLLDLLVLSFIVSSLNINSFSSMKSYALKEYGLFFTDYRKENLIPPFSRIFV